MDELLHLSSTADRDELAALVDASFGRLTPQDLSALEARLKMADEDTMPHVQLLTRCIQASMERRMEVAKHDIDDLLMSSGDIDKNIRECLLRQDSPLPILAVLQMNIERAARGGQEQQVRALTYVFQNMNAELEKEVALVNRVLIRLLGMEDRSAGRELLRKHLDTRADGEAKLSEELASAIVQLVADVEQQFASVSDGSDGKNTREDTLKLVRRVAIDAAMVVNERYGEDEQGRFAQQLQPLFEALSRGCSAQS